MPHSTSSAGPRASSRANLAYGLKVGLGPLALELGEESVGPPASIKLHLSLKLAREDARGLAEEVVQCRGGLQITVASCLRSLAS